MINFGYMDAYWVPKREHGYKKNMGTFLSSW